MTFKILEQDEYDLYIDHVKENPRNSRIDDPDLVLKIEQNIYTDPRILIFAEIENEKIVRSVLTKKRLIIYEYLIVNIRSSTAYFNKNKFLEMFDLIFNYYESQKYYKWILARQINLLNSRYFNNIYRSYPFSKYETAIEAHNNVEGFDKTIYNTEILANTPNEIQKDQFIIISGFCKQRYRSFDQQLMAAFV